MAVDVLRELILKAPPNLAHGIAGLGELIKAGALGRKLKHLPDADLRTLYSLFTRSAGEHLNHWFEDDLVKALFGFDAVVGFYGSPYTPGTGYVLLHHAFGEVNGKRRVWGHAIGGMGAISEAMARAAVSNGVGIETDAPVRELLVEGGRARGVVLNDGRVIRAGAVVVNANLKLFYTSMVPKGALDAEFLRRMQDFRCGSGTFRMNLALSELPSFTALPGRTLADHHTAGIVIGPSLTYMDRAYTDARTHGWSQEPIVELVIPSTLDDTLAPKGAHVASLFCQHVAPELPDGRSWNDHRDEVADLMIATVDRYAPGFKASVIGRQALSPLDLEQCSASSAATFRTARCRSTSCSGHGPCSATPTTVGRCPALSLRRRRASRRRRHRRRRPQCRARDPRRPALAPAVASLGSRRCVPTLAAVDVVPPPAIPPRSHRPPSRHRY